MGTDDVRVLHVPVYLSICLPRYPHVKSTTLCIFPVVVLRLSVHMSEYPPPHAQPGTAPPDGRVALIAVSCIASSIGIQPLPLLESN
ncbi:unnamed protein product [Lampetra planeri]